MFYSIYKITNKVDGKIYIGKHQTKDLKDGYMGSGKHLKRAISKYGIENFEKEILFQFDNEVNMNAKEAELVTEEFCLREDTYNLCPGGKGGWGYINTSGKNLYGLNGKTPNIIKDFVEKGISYSASLNNDPEKMKEHKKKISKSLKDRYSKIDHGWLGKKHSEDTKIKLSQVMKEKQHGKSNSQYGTMWIHSIEEKISKKIDKDEHIPEGWNRGRKLKFN